MDAAETPEHRREPRVAARARRTLHRIKGADELTKLFAEGFTIDNTRTGAVGVATGVGAGAGAAAAGDDTSMLFFCSSVCCYCFLR